MEPLRHTMDTPIPGTSKTSSPTSSGLSLSRTRITRARKRRRVSSESSSDTEVLPDNLLEVEKNLHASAVKNNLDDVSVKKILRTVVRNDHVLALVKLQEEEENMVMSPDSPKPKLTRAKVKELKKVSPKTAWNLENMELMPIKHIPVKTRPEVTALIAQDLAEDEDDDEYEPTNDDIPSDDDQTLESCSDVDSQPRTPATPSRTASPRVVKDGPFKVPQDISTPRRKLNMDSDATIALRTRSKLSLATVPIDTIEGSFVPPDEAPLPAADDVWTEFLHICLNPDTEEADDDDDPEYNVAADPDAHDEDEEGLESIVKISKKELNDLMTELFNVMPENLGDDALAGKLATAVPEKNMESVAPPPPAWEGKAEPLSDEDRPQSAATIVLGGPRLSIGKSEPPSDTECGESEKENRDRRAPCQRVSISVVDDGLNAAPAPAAAPPPRPVQQLLRARQTTVVQVEAGAKILPEQIAILQQQLRQHIQMSACNFLQLFVHPLNWAMAPTYKEYLQQFNKMVLENKNSVTNVCNLKPAVDLIEGWEKSVSADTPENKKLVEFVQKEIERARRRAAQNSQYVGDFPELFMKVVANSPVFLYPHLLPPLPYRSDGVRKFSYMRCEDELIALGLDEFWQYIEDNPDMYKLRSLTSNHRAGLVAAVGLLCEHMLPWMPPRAVQRHIQHVRKNRAEEDNPIVKFFKSREVTPVKHVLLPFNPTLTLYEQPENEMPRIWIRYLAGNSQRFKNHIFRRTTNLNRVGQAPQGVPVEIGAAIAPPPKKPLPINFTQQISTEKYCKRPVEPPKPNTDKFDLRVSLISTPPTNTVTTTIQTTAEDIFYSVIQTANGPYLIPLAMLTNPTDSGTTPICSTAIKDTVPNNFPKESNVPKTTNASVAPPDPTASTETESLNNNVSKGEVAIISFGDHCPCCVKLRKISKRQSKITEFFKTPVQKICPCTEKRNVKYPNVTRKLKLLVNNYKSKYNASWEALATELETLTYEMKRGIERPTAMIRHKEYKISELVTVTSFQLKLTIRTNIVRNVNVKKKIHTLFSRFNPDMCDVYKLTKKLEAILETDGLDEYKEFLCFLTMEQADRMGKYSDYFNQEYLPGFIRKVEELVPSTSDKHEILNVVYTTLKNRQLNSCEICASIIDSCTRYPALADYVFSLFPHINPRLDQKDQNKVGISEFNPPSPKVAPIATENTNESAKKPPKKRRSSRINNRKLVNETIDSSENRIGTPHPTENLQNDELIPQTTDNTEERTIDNEQVSPATDNIEYERIDPVPTDNTENDGEDLQPVNNIEDCSRDLGPTDSIEENRLAQPTEDMEVDSAERTTDNIEDEPMNGAQNVDYEADHSASDDDDRSASLVIIEDPEELNNTRGSNVNIEERVQENVIDTPYLTVTKTEVQDYSESDMSMMIMSEDETSIVKTEPPEWKRDEDKLLLEVLKQCLTPEEMKDKTILEIIEQKNVLQLAAKNLPEKTLDNVRERIVYLLDFLVLSSQMTSDQ